MERPHEARHALRARICLEIPHNVNSLKAKRANEIDGALRDTTRISHKRLAADEDAEVQSMAKCTHAKIALGDAMGCIATKCFRSRVPQGAMDGRMRHNADSLSIPRSSPICGRFALPLVKAGNR